MIDDGPIDYKLEYSEAINELVKLRQKYDELEEDRDYVKSLLDVEFEKRIKLQKEIGQLKQEIMDWKEKYRISEENLIYETSSTIKEDLEKLKKELEE